MPKKKTPTTARPFKLIVTRLISEHTTKAEASEALKALKPAKGALGVVIKVGKLNEVPTKI